MPGFSGTTSVYEVTSRRQLTKRKIVRILERHQDIGTEDQQENREHRGDGCHDNGGVASQPQRSLSVVRLPICRKFMLGTDGTQMDHDSLLIVELGRCTMNCYG